MLLPLTISSDLDTINQLRLKFIDTVKHHSEKFLKNELHLCLACGICLNLIPREFRSPNFYLNDVGHSPGVLVLSKLIESIRVCTKVKSEKMEMNAG